MIPQCHKKFGRGHICSKDSMAGAEFAFKFIVDSLTKQVLLG